MSTEIDITGINYTSSELNISNKQVAVVLDLLKNQNATVPFISRYRKEAHGGLDEVQVGKIGETYDSYLEREKRRKFIIETIDEMKKLTPELKKKIETATTMSALEDLYAPYKSKRKTKGQKAAEAGLDKLALKIESKDHSKEQFDAIIEKEYLSEEYKTVADVWTGVKFILMEKYAHNVEAKDVLRSDFWKSATLKTSLKKDGEKVQEAQKFKDYFEFEQPIATLKDEKAAHRFLAVRRAMNLGVLKVEVNYDVEVAYKTLKAKIYGEKTEGFQEFIDECLKKSYSLYIHPSLDLEVKTELKKFSDEAAINVFGINLKNLLLQPYLGQKAVLGIDPGIRTGCKVAVIDKNGNFLADTVIYPFEPKCDVQGAKKIIETCIEQLGIEYIAIGNGTNGKETLEFLQRSVEKVKDGSVKALLVNEDGASIYSASDIARKEFPDKDLTVRGAISIARRFQDPLGELVKIDPKSIGVGQYQHDVNQAKLKKSLSGIVESCVNYVGVDLNTASAPLLSFVSGIGPSVAENVIKYREKIKGFKTRDQLLKVGRFSEKVFEQSAGFLRIYEGENPLDGTFIHPEKYSLIQSWCDKNNIKLTDLTTDSKAIQTLEKDAVLKREIGEFTFADIIKSLKAPKQDPREEFKPFEYREDLKTINDLKAGEWYPGIVTNITQFGAFVDIGIKENGLIHISQMADKFVSNALEVLKVGEKVKAKVIEVDHNRKRIALSLKSDSEVKRSSSRTNNFKSNNHKQQNFKQKAPTNNPFASLSGLNLKK